MFIAGLSFMCVAYLLYGSLETSNRQRREDHEKNKADLDQLETKLGELETELERNDRLMQNVRAVVEHRTTNSRREGGGARVTSVSITDTNHVIADEGEAPAEMPNIVWVHW